MTRSRRSPGANDPRTQPAYPLGEAAHYLRVPAATLRAWVAGRPYPTSKGTEHSVAVIIPASSEPLTLSFWNLIEAHVLRALRTEHSVSLGDVRTALSYAEKQFGIRNLLLHEKLRASAGELFLER